MSHTPKCDAALRRLASDAPKTSKAPLHLIPFDALGEVAHVFQVGAEKYAPNDWKNKDNGGGAHHAAALRHLGAFCDGEALDAESRRHHLAHAAARCLMQLWKEMNRDRQSC